MSTNIDFLGALGAGSDIDTKSLVTALVDAEKAPRESRINTNIDNTEAKISAYGELASSLSILQLAFADLKDVSDFDSTAVAISNNLSSSGAAALTVSADGDAVAGTSASIQVTQVAQPDRWVSDGFAAIDSDLNNGSDIVVTLTIGGASSAVEVADPTPTAIVSAINAADLGVTATLLDTGAASNPFKIVLEGQLGADNAFTISTDASVGTMPVFNTQTSTAQDSILSVNGVSVQRTTNIIDDVIAGLTFNITDQTASTALVSVTQVNDELKLRLQSMVDAYNDFDDLVSEKMASGEVFSGNATVRMIASQVKSMIASESSTATSNFGYFSEIGISFDRYGQLEIDEDTLDSMLSDYLDDVVSIVTADTENQSSFGDLDRGLAGDIYVLIDDMLASDGVFANQSDALEAKAGDYADQLVALNLRMEGIYDRYLAQFTAMETAVDQMNGMKDYLETALSGLPFTSKND
jgi:flagellar hook-associated protein 2